VPGPGRELVFTDGRVDMTANVGSAERAPRIAMALAAGVGGVFAPGAFLKGMFWTAAAALAATVATSYCPVNEILGRNDTSEPTWRTIKTWRVEA
jgi:hypothetical protein